MRIRERLAPYGLIVTLALSVLPVSAEVAVPTLYGAQGTVTAIGLYDTDHDGRMDRVRLTVDNSSHASWHASGTAGLKLTHNGADVTLTDAWFSTPPAAHPATLEVSIDESDLDLPVTTSADLFELSYVAQGLGSGVDDGSTELMAIAEGDTDAHDTELDMAAPLLLASNPVAGAYRVQRDELVVLTFSEPILQSSLTYAVSSNPGQWSASWSEDGTVATLQHLRFQAATLSFTVTAAQDFSGNALATGGYPNPFHFRTTSDTQINPPDNPDAVLVITHPVALDALHIGSPNLINWYTNQTEAASFRLSYSINEGINYHEIFTLPATETSFVWYPPNLPGGLILKLESYTLSSSPLNVQVTRPLSLALPDDMPAPFAVTGPAVSGITDTAATVTMTLDRPVASLDLVCNGAVLASANVPLTSPAPVVLELSGLTKGSSYACHFAMIDLFGKTSSIAVPAFIASSAGDVTPPSIVGIPKLDLFDAAAKTARLTWTTDEATTAHVNYGTYLNYGTFVDDASLETTHSVTLSGLAPGELHQARVTMLDASGNAAVTEDIWFVFLTEDMLVKAKDASAVYWYKDGKRNVFPNATIYRSWFGDDFSKVVTIPTTQLGTVPLGKNVKVKADSYLIKITSDPKTYAVEPDGTLRWIPTEEMARALYGDAWNTIIRDIDVSFFVDYAIGEPLTTGEEPAGYSR